MNTMWLIVLVVLGVQSALLAVLCWQLRQQSRRLDAQGDSPRTPTTDVPTAMLVTAVSRLEQRLTQLESHLHRPDPGPTANPGDRSYDLAQRLARQGASARQIAESCGIGLQEAELVLRTHTPG